jgi:predicted Zn-dependent protease
MRHLIKSITLAATAALLTASCATSPTGQRQLSLVSDSQMASLGASAYSDMKKSIPISTDPRATAYVRCIANAITTELSDNQSWEVTVFDDDQVNAFALPGGKIGVYTGLLKVAETPDQLAAVMGHEVAHVLANHGKARYSANIAGQAGLLAGQILIGASNSSNKRGAMAALGIGLQFGVMMPYGRSHETEADILGLDLLAKAGFDPRASTQLWRNMAKANPGAPPEFMSTHPAPTTRISNLQNRMPKAMSLYQQARNSGRTPNCRAPAQV